MFSEKSLSKSVSESTNCICAPVTSYRDISTNALTDFKKASYHSSCVHEKCSFNRKCALFEILVFNKCSFNHKCALFGILVFN